MGRRSQHSPDVLREMILDAAEAIIAEGGLTLLSAREIAKRIEYSPGTLYNMFQNLDDVVVSVEGRILDKLARSLQEADSVAASGNPRDRLMALTRAYVTFTHDNSRLWNVLFEHRLPDGQDLPDWYMAKLATLLTQIELALTPYFSGSDTAGRARAARVLWAAVHGITSLSTSGKLMIVTSEAASGMAEDLVSVYLQGLEASRGA